MTTKTSMRANAAIAILAGLLLRIFFALRFPATGSGDSLFYIQLAWNWLHRGTYGAVINGRLVPLDTRVPGYPAFLAAVFAVAGRSLRAVMLAQVVLDLGTCWLVALVAARLAPGDRRSRAALAGLWLAALCPFTANYTAVVLTETLVTFLTALGLLVVLEAYAETPAPDGTRVVMSPWFLAGIIGGLGALVRPEMPLLLVAAAVALLARWWRRADWPKLLRAGVLLTSGGVLTLMPWAARNWRSLGEVQFLAPRHANLPGELVPLGFDAWTRTWLWRYGDVYLTLWKLEDEPIPPDSLPARAFDSPAERARVAALLGAYNDTLTLTPEIDRGFAEIARERTARDRFRTYLGIPLLRSLAMWFTPRVELLPFSGELFPLRSEWEYDREDLVVTLLLFATNCAYVALALGGAWVARGSCGWAFLVVFLLLRTLFFASFIDTPEPRYVLECFPAVIAFAAQVFSFPRAARGEWSTGRFAGSVP
jgi:Dolichyl-phosphate-mannose-protein mannosyltransferase